MDRDLDRIDRRPDDDIGTPLITRLGGIPEAGGRARTFPRSPPTARSVGSSALKDARLKDAALPLLAAVPSKRLEI